MSNDGKITLFDRFAVGFLSALCAFFSIGFIFMMLAYATHGDFIFANLKILMGITFAFYVLGFVTLDNWFIPILEPVWRLIEKLIK